MIVVASMLEIPLGTVLVPGQPTPMGWVYNGVQFDEQVHEVASRVMKVATFEEWRDYNIGVGVPAEALFRVPFIEYFYWAQVD